MFNNSKILVFGDSMIDSYLWGKINRNSPEAKVPIVDIDAMEHRLGGAANVAINIKYLGAQVDLMSIIGQDSIGNLFIELLQVEEISTDHLIVVQDRKTTLKTRIYNGDEYVLRYDDEHIDDLFKEDQEVVIHLFEQYIIAHQPALVVFQDYNKGLLTKNIIQKTLSICNQYKIKTAVDPKLNNFFEYQNITLFKPNLKEVRDALQIHIETEEEIQQACELLKDKLKADKILITLSEKGAILFSDQFYRVAAVPRNIVDVSGAGDTVIAVASICLANQWSDKKLVEYSNLAGGLVCEKAGVVYLTKETLFKEI